MSYIFYYLNFVINKGYKRSSRSGSIEVIESKRTSSIKDRLGKRREGSPSGVRRRKMAADNEEDERLVKLGSKKIQVK